MYIITADDELVHRSGFANKDFLALSATLTRDFNKSGTLSMLLPPNNYAYTSSKLKKLSTVIKVYRNNMDNADNLVWKGRILDSKRDFLGRMEYKCEGWLSVLCDSVVRPEGDKDAGISINPGTYFEQLIAKHNAQVGPSKSFTAHVKGFDGGSGSSSTPVVHESHSQISWGSSGSDVRTCQEYLNRVGYNLAVDGIFGQYTYNAVTSFQSNHGLDVDGIVGQQTWYALEEAISGKRVHPLATATFPVGAYESTLDYIQQNFLSNPEVGGRIWVVDNDIYLYADGYEDFCDQTITFGENLLDITEYVNAANIYTMLIPEGKDGLLLTNEYGVDYVTNDAAVALFGKIYHHESYSDIETASELRKKALEDLAVNIEESITMTISAFDLSLLNANSESFKIGKYTRVVSPPHGIDKYWLCTSLSIDLCNPANSKYTLGLSTDTLTAKQVKLAKAK